MESDCTTQAPSPDEWTADATGDPEADGATNGWTGACDDFYDTAVGNDALFWGHTVVVSKDDCETAGP